MIKFACYLYVKIRSVLFYRAAREPDISTLELSKRLGISQPTASQSVKKRGGNRERKATQGDGLIYINKTIPFPQATEYWDAEQDLLFLTYLLRSLILPNMKKAYTLTQNAKNSTPSFVMSHRFYCHMQPPGYKEMLRPAITRNMPSDSFWGLWQATGVVASRDKGRPQQKNCRA